MTIGAYANNRCFGMGTGVELKDPPPGAMVPHTELVGVFGPNRFLDKHTREVVAYYVTLANWVSNVRNWYERSGDPNGEKGLADPF